MSDNYERYCKGLFSELKMEISELRGETKGLTAIVTNGMQSDIRMIKRILGWGAGIGFSTMIGFMIWLIQELVKGR